MYHLYHLISEGDRVSTHTVRNVVSESSTGSVKKERVHFKITIEVMKVDFDSEQCSLRLNGKNIVESDFIKVKNSFLAC